VLYGGPVSDIPAPPARRLREPRWLDPRLVLGVLLILLSIVLAARVLGSADRSIRVWSLTRDLPRGAELTAADLAPARVRLFGSGEAYLPATGERPVGRVLARDVGKGELLPRAALADGGAEPARLVTVPVRRSHALGGELGRGDLVDIIATVGQPGRGGVTRPVLTGVMVVDVVAEAAGFGRGSADFAIVVSVAPADAVALAAAVQGAELDVVTVVPAGGRSGDIGDGDVVVGPVPSPR
jgi:hypothetical protein